MSKKCRAYSESKLGLTLPDSRKAFYAGWDAAVAAEREACAKIAEEHQHDCYDGDIDWHEARRITAAIRARGEE